jgi:hypothetical protein
MAVGTLALSPKHRNGLHRFGAFCILAGFVASFF